MSTAAQQQANKQNAQHSTGPRTSHGKKRSRLNAIKHGLRAKDPLIPGENRDDFYKHASELEFHLLPANPVEENLVEQIIDITWRLKRCGRIESALITELFDSTSEQPENQDTDRDRLLGKALVPDARLAALNRLDRHEASLARRYHNAMKDLREARKRRAQSALFSGLYNGPRRKPQAEPDTDADNQSEMTKPTQSIATLLESIAPMRSSDPEPPPRAPVVNGFPPIQAESSGRLGTQEAAKQIQLHIPPHE